jgi:hypothetical protein
MVVDGGLSDHEEIRGVEQDAAHASPFKGRQCLNSEVSVPFNSQLIISDTLIYNRLSWSTISPPKSRKMGTFPTA